LNIAEDTGRSSDKALDYHLEIAFGSAYEVVASSFLALDRAYINEDEQKNLYVEGERPAKGINAFRKTLNKPLAISP
jgi:four helix bundle protein